MILLIWLFILFHLQILFSQEQIKLFFSKGKSDNQIQCISFSDDERFLGIATNYWIELRDPQTLQQLSIFENHRVLIKSMCWSPDGHTIAVGYTDGSIKLWDIDSNRELLTLKKHMNVVTCLAFSSDGKYLASGDWGGGINLWDVKNGKRLRNLVKHLALVRTLDFSPRNDLLVSGSADNLIVLWSVMDGEIVDVITHHSSTVSSAKFNKKGDKIYSSSWDKTIKIWDMRLKTSTFFAGLSEFVNSISFSPDESKLACGLINGTILVFNLETQKVLDTISAYDKSLLGVVFSPSGKLFSAGDLLKVTSHKLEERLSDLPEVGSDIWLDLGLDDIGEIYDMLKEPDSKTIYLATEKKGLLKSLDGKTNWQKIDRNIKDIVIAIAMDDKKVLYVVTKSKGVFVSEDGGKTWKEDNEGLFQISKGIYQKIFDIEVQSKINKWFLATEKGIYKKEKKWENVSDKVVHKLCFSPKNNKKLYAGTHKGGLFLSNDSGKSWSLLLKEREEEQPVREITVDPETEEIFIARDNDGVLISDDNKNFREKNFGLPSNNKTVYALKMDPKNRNKIVAATDKGIFISRNRGDVWKEYNDGIDTKTAYPFKAVLVSDEGRVLAGGGSGLFEVGSVKEKKVLSSINFETDSDRINPSAFFILDQIIKSVKFTDMAQIIINGHTDNVGEESYNIGLSLRRAISAKKYFVEKNIPENRIKTFGFGLTKPLVSNTTEEGRAKNRRVEILIAE